MPGTESVKVIVRVRPLNSSEIQRGCNNVTQVNSPQHQLTISNPSTSAIKTFAYDAVYPTDCTQQSIYDETAFPLVESVIQGYNGTIFAYGQTGCGKTFTMVGEIDNPDLRGIIPNSFQHIFGAISEADDSVIFLVRCSYSEIYNEEIRDLLNFDPSNKLELKENKDKGIYVKGLSMQTVKTTADIEKAMEYGNKYRVTKGTNMNARSSRSHAIFTIYIETSETIEGQQRFKVGKLNLVDLAGSERQKKTGATGDRLKEGIKINLSLSALGNVISALVDGDTTHVPYRDSKLTRLLQDSLGGNTKTVMCAVISPADYNYDESLSTLRYASRAKFIQNKPTINEDPKDALLRQYADEIARLKALLAANGGGAEPIIVEKVVEKFIEVPVERKRRRKRQEGDNGRIRNADDEGDYEGGGTKIPSRRRKRTNGSQDYAEEEVIHGKSTTSRNLKGGQNGRADDDELRAVKGNNEVLRSRHRRKRRDKAANNAEDETYGAASPLNSMNPQQRQKRVRRQQKESANNSIEELPEDDSEYQNSSQKRFKRRTTKKTQQLESDSDQESYTPYGDDPIPSHFGGGENLPTTRKNQIKRRQQVSTEVGDDNRKLRKKTLNTQSSKYIPTADDVLSPPANPPQVQSRRRKRPTLKEGRQPGRADQEKQEQLSRDQLIEEQQQEQEKLKKLLDDLQHKLIAGGETLENFEIEKAKQQRAFRIKLKKQRKREQQLLEQNRQKEEEMLMKESQYQNLQEEVTDQRKLIKKLRIKYRASLEEVNDLNKEHEIEKEALFDTIRMRERDLEFLHHVFERILHPSEFQKIKQRSQYDEDNHTWHIPQFVLNQNTTQFPKLPKAQVKEIADRDLNARKVTFSDGGGQIQLNDKLRNARFDRMPSSDDEYGRGSNTYPFNSEKEEIHYTPSMQQMKPNKMTMLNPINASSLTNNGQMAAVGFRKKAPVKIKSSSQNPNRAILEPIHRRG